jgi:predicted RNA-binding protein with PIN domain
MPYWFDGNNLIGQSAATAQADSRTSRAFLSSLSRYRRPGGRKFLVYFDGDDSNRFSTPPGIAVRYSAPLSADEAITRRLREIRHPSEVIVVSNDRELINRCREAGAKTMNWRQFIAKMQSRSTSSQPDGELKEPVDVEEWAKYFGLDKSKMQ